MFFPTYRLAIATMSLVCAEGAGVVDADAGGRELVVGRGDVARVVEGGVDDADADFVVVDASARLVVVLVVED